MGSAHRVAVLRRVGDYTNRVCGVGVCKAGAVAPAYAASGRRSRRGDNRLRVGEETKVDMGIRGRAALVCAASKGLGKGCAMALAREGVNVTLVARGAEALNATAEEIRTETDVQVIAVVADITTPEGRKKALEACPSPDILVNNAAGPPPGDFREWDREAWIKAIDANMLTPIELIKATVDSMSARKFGRIVNITSSAVKAPIDILGLSNGARSGLTGFVAGLARKTVA